MIHPVGPRSIHETAPVQPAVSPLLSDSDSKTPSFGEVLNEPTSSTVDPSDPAADADDPLRDADDPLRDAFTQFVGQTFFGAMMASMRSTVGRPAYMHGGRGEEVFQKQLDAQMVEQLTESSAESFADPMFELFRTQRS